MIMSPSFFSQVFEAAPANVSWDANADARFRDLWNGDSPPSSPETSKCATAESQNSTATGQPLKSSKVPFQRESFKALSQRASFQSREPKVATCDNWTEKDTRDAVYASPPPSDGKIAEAVPDVVQARVKPRVVTHKNRTDDDSCDVAAGKIKPRLPKLGKWTDDESCDVADCRK